MDADSDLDIDMSLHPYRDLDSGLEALSSPSETVRVEAAQSLGALGDRGAVPALIARLEDSSPEVAGAAAVALGALQADEAFQPLCEALQWGAPELRHEVAFAIARIRPHEAGPHLASQLGDAEPMIITGAAGWIGMVGYTPAIPLLVPLLAHHDLQVRQAAARALAAMKDPRGRAVLADLLLSSEDPLDTYSVIEALESLGEPVDADTLATAFDGLVHDDRESAARAAKAILAIQPAHPRADDARQLLLHELQHAPSAEARSNVAEYLGELGGQWALAVLAEHGELTDTVRLDALTGKSRPN